jgi:phage/plasmid-like protein (TIGR03299 family)
VWVLARIPHDITIPGTDDTSQMYLLFSNSHDRSSRARIKLVALRVVCQNTIAIALNEDGEEIWISHTAQFEQKLKKARELMAGAVNGVEEMRKKLHELASREMSAESLRAALDRIYPKIEDAMSESAITRRERVLDDILRLYEHNDGNMFPSIRNTGLNLLNAVVEHTDHYRGTRITARREGYTKDQARAESALFGTGEQLKRRALEVIMQTTSNNARRDITKVYVPMVPAPLKLATKAVVVPEINGLLGQVVDATPEVRS